MDSLIFSNLLASECPVMEKFRFDFGQVYMNFCFIPLFWSINDWISSCY